MSPGPPHYRGSAITFRRTTLGRTPLDEWSARRSKLWQPTTLARDRHTCRRRVSNPQPQQASGRRPTPLAALKPFEYYSPPPGQEFKTRWLRRAETRWRRSVSTSVGGYFSRYAAGWMGPSCPTPRGHWDRHIHLYTYISVPGRTYVIFLCPSVNFHILFHFTCSGFVSHPSPMTKDATQRLVSANASSVVRKGCPSASLLCQIRSAAIYSNPYTQTCTHTHAHAQKSTG